MHFWITALAVSLAVSLVFNLSTFESAKQIEHATRFKGQLVWRLFLSFGIMGGIWGACAVAFSKDFRTDWWVCLVLGGMALGALQIWPQEIVASHNEIIQNRFFGLARPTVVEWKDVDYSTNDPSSGTIQIVSKEGRKIVFGSFHAGSAEFARIASRYDPTI